MLDDLRQAALDQEDDAFESHTSAISRSREEAKLFGMTAVERMFLSIGLFAITVVVSILLLVVTESIAFNF